MLKMAVIAILNLNLFSLWKVLQKKFLCFWIAPAALPPFPPPLQFGTLLKFNNCKVGSSVNANTICKAWDFPWFLTCQQIKQKVQGESNVFFSPQGGATAPRERCWQPGWGGFRAGGRGIALAVLADPALKATCERGANKAILFCLKCLVLRKKSQKALKFLDVSWLPGDCLHQ